MFENQFKKPVSTKENTEETKPIGLETQEQEEFEMKIEAEAKRLGTSTEELIGEIINKYGSTDNFVETLEKEMSSGHGSEDIKKLNNEEDVHNFNSKLALGFSTVAVSLNLALEKLGDESAISTIKHVIEKIKTDSDISIQEYGTAGLFTALTLISVPMIVSSISEKIKENQTKRKIKKEELKHQIAGITN